MQLIIIAVVLAVAIVAFTQFRKRSADAMVAAAYFLNVKPAIEKFGFQGEEQNVIEQGCVIDSLYYLKNFNQAATQLKGVSKISNQPFATFWAAHRGNDINPLASNDWNQYIIAFMPSVAKGRNKAILSLKVTNPARRDELGLFGMDMTMCIAPLHFYNETNLRQILTRMMFDIEQFENEGSVTPKWLVFDIPDHLAGEGNTCCGLPVVLPKDAHPLDKTLKAAHSRMRDGYRS